MIGCAMVAATFIFIPFTSVPMRYQARVFSIIGVFCGITSSLGASTFGFMVERFGVTFVMVGAGISCGILFVSLFLEGSVIKLLKGGDIFEEDLDTGNVRAAESN